MVAAIAVVPRDTTYSARSASPSSCPERVAAAVARRARQSIAESSASQAARGGHVTDALPLTAMDKLDRRALAADNANVGWKRARNASRGRQRDR